MSIHYAHEKFSLAVEGMATSAESIQMRVANAWSHNLIHVTGANLPADSAKRLKALGERLTRVQPTMEGEGTILATARQMSDEEAVQIAKEIVSLAYQVEVASKEPG